MTETRTRHPFALFSRLRGRTAATEEGTDAHHDPRPGRGQPHSIVPGATITGSALVAVVAIMTFLAGLTIGSVAAVRTVAADWTSQIARETTIQIKPGDGLDIKAALDAAVMVAKGTEGVADARALGDAETAALLEPWLGSGLDLSSLPVPRLVIVKLGPEAGPQTLLALRAGLAAQVPSATFDDHRQWSDRLIATARLVVLIGLAVLALVGAATVLSVVFATRAAVDAARAIVEVLHFVGARDNFIAAAFQHHFLWVGLKGGMIGGGAAMALFFLGATLPGWLGLTSRADTLIGAVGLDMRGYGGILGVSVLVALVTAITSRITVYRTLRRIS
ncbi:cell division protein FtsX [Ancylobacter sp. SL191]|uniref:cell division protein FtsX n=1 Tax=Ancylobacter sp. SL191 TaxID=2995166 RepID=UPI00226D6953|nr:ABC transporter permease [Ancylobacter sp. SL191]WAC28614.1 ABC transporter permease [Ancylobacter sp. SL191]